MGEVPTVLAWNQREMAEDLLRQREAEGWTFAECRLNSSQILTLASFSPRRQFQCVWTSHLSMSGLSNYCLRQIYPSLGGKKIVYNDNLRSEVPQEQDRRRHHLKLHTASLQGRTLSTASGRI